MLYAGVAMCAHHLEGLDVGVYQLELELGQFKFSFLKP